MTGRSRRRSWRTRHHEGWSGSRRTIRRMPRMCGCMIVPVRGSPDRGQRRSRRSAIMSSNAGDTSISGSTRRNTTLGSRESIWGRDGACPVGNASFALYAVVRGLGDLPLKGGYADRDVSPLGPDVGRSNWHRRPVRRGLARRASTAIRDRWEFVSHAIPDRNDGSPTSIRKWYRTWPMIARRRGSLATLRVILSTSRRRSRWSQWTR